jgi:prevent-host-death family protein
VDVADAKAPLSEYVREIRKGTVVVVRRGKAVAAVVPLSSSDWEDFVVSQDPGFARVIRRSDERYRVEGGITLEQARRKYGLPPEPASRSRKAR